MTSTAKSTYARNVFVNCPFDSAYKPLFQAIVFTVHECGFFVRCGLERTDASELRVKKIYDLIESSRYGIHDLSRVELDSGTGLPRFNMPLELGIFLGAKFLGPSKQRTKSCLVFDEHPHRYQMYMSDIAGQDIESHHNDPQRIVSSIRNWLAHDVEGNLPGGRAIKARLDQFERELTGLCQSNQQERDELSYSDFIQHVVEFTSSKEDRLETGFKTRWGTELKSPSLGHIREALRGLKGGGPNSFAILSKAGTGRSYVQVSGSASDGYVVEYQDGGPSAHYQNDCELEENQLIRLFQQFRSGDRSWIQSVNWKKHEWWAPENG